MSPIDPKLLRQNETKRRRGWILNFLYTSRPQPLEFASLIYLLDKTNFPVSVHRLAEDLDYLRGLRLLRVFPVGATEAISDVDQAKLVQRFAQSDGDLNDDFSACLTAKGVNYQEGHIDELGITRVN
jgi:hypothetical protein